MGLPPRVQFRLFWRFGLFVCLGNHCLFGSFCRWRTKLARYLAITQDHRLFFKDIVRTHLHRYKEFALTTDLVENLPPK